MNNYFGPARFSKVGKLFQDLPLEALDKSVTGLNNAYSDNLTKFNNVEASISAIKSSNADDWVKQEKIKAIQDKMRSFAESDGFENADRFVGSLASEVLGDRELQLMQENYQRQLQDEDLQAKLRGQGVTAIDARDFYNGKDFSSVTVGEDGSRNLNTYRGGIIKQGEYDAAKTRLFDQMPERGGTYYVDGPNGSKIAKTWTGIREKDIEGYSGEAFKRYKGSDEYQTELIDLQVQGYTPEQADEIIKESITATGSERVGTKSNSRMYGYQNPSSGSGKTDVPGRRTKFMRDPRSVATSDPNGLWSAVGLGGEDKSGIPIAGTSTVQHSGEVVDVNLNKFYKIEHNNSDSSDSGKLSEGNELFKGVQQSSERAYIYADGEHANEMVILGDGAPNSIGRGFSESAQPELEEGTGKYFFKDEDGAKHYVKPRNFKKYMDEDKNMYYAPMDRQEELKEFGADFLTNARPIELGASQGAYGATYVESYDDEYVSNSINSIVMDPQASSQYTQVVAGQLQNGMASIQAAVDQGSITMKEAKNLPTVKAYKNIQNFLGTEAGANPANLLHYMNGRIKANKDANQNTLDAEVTEYAKILNDIMMDYEEKGLQDNTPKQSTQNLFDRDSNSIQGLIQD